MAESLTGVTRMPLVLRTEDGVLHEVGEVEIDVPIASIEMTRDGRTVAVLKTD